MVSEGLLEFAAERYGFDATSLRFISESTNQVYMFSKGGRAYILRLSARPADQFRVIMSEMDWLRYLAECGVGVSMPLPSRDGALAVVTEWEGENYIICSFEVVPGRFWDKNNPALWNERIFYNWGKTTGTLHRVTKDYTPSDPAARRGDFTGRDALMRSVEACQAVNKIAEELSSELLALPRDRDSYGLIHCDLHPWNFYIDNDNINVFDFDDSLYGHFALDIGIALYHGLWWGRKNDVGQDFSEPMIENFLCGYLSENALGKFWLERIPLFMRYRQICKFSWFYNPQNDDAHQRERIGNIERGALFSDLALSPEWFTNI